MTWNSNKSDFSPTFITEPNHNYNHHQQNYHNHQQQPQQYHNHRMINIQDNPQIISNEEIDPSRVRHKHHSQMQLLFLFASAVIALILFILLISHGVPWTNFEIFLLSIVTIVLIASLVGFIIGVIRSYCWRTNVSTNPTPMTMYTNPPPIGSAEAEFQNEYIPVFPMRQLKPRVDLDNQ